MQTEMQPINGSETETHTDELKALSLFYNAFKNRNMTLIQHSWLNTDEISMDNPIGGIRRGWTEIQSGYDRIFNGKAKVYVEFYDYTIHITADMFFATGRERGTFKTEETTLDLAIRTSRIFVKSNGVWRQFHHHGSIDNPTLLKAYQEAIVT